MYVLTGLCGLSPRALSAVGIVVSGMIVKQGVVTTLEAVRGLMDVIALMTYEESFQ